METYAKVKWLIPFLFIPALMLIMAIIFYYKQPMKINQLYGYRTSLSMKNQDTWMVANRLSSACFLYTSIGFLTVLTLLLILIGRSVLVSWFGNLHSLFSIIAVFSTALVLLPIVVTEYKLRQIFTADGIRK